MSTSTANVIKMSASKTEKLKALESAIGQIEKAFGKGSVMKLGQSDTVVDIEAVSTGSLGLDIALGIGGALVVAEVADDGGSSSSPEPPPAPQPEPEPV